jgi:predicted  nucleic acid-binding Zn-ribbon protein
MMNTVNNKLPSFSIIYLTFIVALVYSITTINSSNAEEIQSLQANVEKKLNELDKRLTSLEDTLDKDANPKLFKIETDLNNLKSEIDNNVDTITKVAEQALYASEKTFNRITWIVSVVATLITLTAGFLAFIGYKERKDIDRIKERAEEELNNIKNKSSQIDSELQNLQQNINTLKADLDAELNLRIARDYIISGISYKEGLRIIREVLKNTLLNNRIKAKAYAMKGFALKRLNRPSEAFAVLEEAIKLDSTNPIYFLNCACYAALIENVDKCIYYLRLGIEKWKEPEYDDFKRLIKDELNKKEDNDFSKIKNTEVFNKFLNDIGIA